MPPTVRPEKTGAADHIDQDGLEVAPGERFANLIHRCFSYRQINADRCELAFEGERETLVRHVGRGQTCDLEVNTTGLRRRHFFAYCFGSALWFVCECRNGGIERPMTRRDG